MFSESERLIMWVRWGIILAAVGALAVGGLSVCTPQRSIGLYQWIMAQFNWRVAPIDAPREVRTTRWLGLVLIVLSLALLWRMWR